MQNLKKAPALKTNEISLITNTSKKMCYKKQVMGFKPNIRTSYEGLKIRHLKDLFDNKIAALRVPNFCSPSAVCQAIDNLKSKEIVDYNNAPGVGKFKDVGMAFFEIEDEESKKAYYEQRINSFQAVREVFFPYSSPIDELRAALDEQWPHGASLLDLGEGPMFSGLVRAVKQEILPHEDKLERDCPEAISKIHYVSQLAFNCYLSCPLAGGALELYGISLADETYKKLAQGSYGINRSLLPKPQLTLQPEAGELIAFNPRYLHSVSMNTDEIPRLAVSTFVLYQGKNLPLRLWS
jgi:hypothetical protein